MNDYNAAAPATSAERDDRRFARLAIEEARKSVPEDERIHPRVGIVVVKDGRVLATAHRGEFRQCHGEFVALEKKLADGHLRAGCSEIWRSQTRLETEADSES